MRIFKVLLVKLQIFDRRQCTMCECDRCYLSNKHSFFNFIYVDYLVPILADCKCFVMVLYGELGVGSWEFGVALLGRLRQQSSELQGEIIILLSSLPTVLKRCFTWGNPKTALFAPNSQLPNFLVKIHSLRCANHVDGVNKTGSFGLTRNN